MLDLILSGIFWIVSGIAYTFSVKTTALTPRIAMVTSFILVLLFKLLVFILQFSECDEMSDTHYKQVRAEGYTSLLRIVLMFGLAGAVGTLWGNKLVNNWYARVLMIIGAMELFAGIRFYKRERDGKY